MDTTTPQLVLVLGGCRSGKSRFALELAARLGKRKLFVATAEPFDDEMRERIAKHRADRGPDWQTVEAPVGLAEALRDHAAEADVVVVDCLTVWLGNLLCPEHQPLRWQPGSISSLLAGLAKRCAHIIVVSNEVGLGIVPDNALARRFRDEQGRLNQQVAAIADSVVFVAAGLPVTLKGKLPQSK
ncbi:MAG: bifunctional adenosylcobinamide kinase/adenosylcobinamide-phosphate guanylyltransferase [Verrucomicrobia bacterium]|nr:bifunctional adenosylcobinamide kinase/adenosylcobinamide-phosphate guanylyltransferase [Verrucomicrobiota bacterium]